MKDMIELFNRKKNRKKSSPENIVSSSPKLGVADFSRFSMISLSNLLREIIENLEKSATPNFGELETIFSGEDFFDFFFKSSIISFISATLELQRTPQKNWHAF